MKTLFITFHYLSGNGGGPFASRAYINAFASASEEMTLVYPVNDIENEFDEIDKKIELIPVRNDNPKWKKFINLLFGKVHRFSDVAGNLAQTRHYDLVVFDTSMASYRLIDMFKSKGSRVFVIHHNFQYEYFRDNAQTLLMLPTLFWCRMYEKQAVRKADLNLALTDPDIHLLSKAYLSGNESSFVRLGVFEFSHHSSLETRGKRSGNKNFCITGNLGDPQTRNSLLPWISEYYPILKGTFPASKLVVAGRNPDPSIIEACTNNNITLIASPISMNDILAEADCYICPTSLGGGMKLRIMDGLKMGLPVITHKVAARGYELFEKGRCLFSYSDKDSFAEALRKYADCGLDRDDIIELYRCSLSFESGCELVKEICKRYV